MREQLQQLEKRLQQTESSIAQASHPAAAGDNAFNPAISLILSGTYGNLQQNPDIPITTFRCKRDGGNAVKLRVNIGTDSQFRFLQAEAPAVAMVVGEHGEAGNRDIRVLLKIAIGAGEDE